MSMASHPRSEFWSRKNVNSDGNFINPRNILKNSREKYYFECNVCNHTFENIADSVTRSANPSWCCYCSNRMLCGKESCKMCKAKSIASNDLGLLMINNNPYTVFRGSMNEYLFKCNKCPHTFMKKPCDISKGYFCPYCPKGRKILCENESCKTCFDNSFASNPRAKHWSLKNKISPRQITRAVADKKFWFNCDRCENEFQASPCHIAWGQWCPRCKNKTELKLFEQLKKVFPNVQPQYFADWCKNEKGQWLPFDFVIHDLKIIIELDGDQHFTQVSKWKSPEEQFKNDLYKMKKCKENGYSVIRIYQPDVFKDKNNWLQKLIHSIYEVFDLTKCEDYSIELDKENIIIWGPYYHEPIISAFRYISSKDVYQKYIEAFSI